jgi:hypothetical protein
VSVRLTMVQGVVRGVGRWPWPAGAQVRSLDLVEQAGHRTQHWLPLLIMATPWYNEGRVVSTLRRRGSSVECSTLWRRYRKP